MADSEAHGAGPWWEVQGLALCALHGDRTRGRGACKVPVDGDWHAIYFLASETEAKQTLNFVMDTDDDWLDHFEDFRMVPPNPKSLRRRDKEQAERAAFVSRRRGEAEAAIKPVKAKKKRKVAA